MNAPRLCIYPRCTKVTRVRGYCGYHYEKLTRLGLLPFTGRVVADPSPIRTRIAEHLARGRTLHDLADRATTCPTVVRRLHLGCASCRRTTATRIMAVPLPPTMIGVRRRLDALARIGFSLAAVSRISGVSSANLQRSLRTGRCSAATRLRLAAAYEQLSATPQHAPRVVTLAKRAGKRAPADWEYLDIDDPAVWPDSIDTSRDVDEIAVEMLVKGHVPAVRPPRPTYVEAVARLTGCTGAEIARRLRVTVRTVERMRKELQGEAVPPGGQRFQETCCRGTNRHPFTPENTRIDCNGKRHCRACEQHYKKTHREAA